MRIPIEGARTVVDCGTVLILVGLTDALLPEVQAVETGAAALAAFMDAAVVAVAFRLGDDPHAVTSLAPADFHDSDAEPGDFLRLAGGFAADGQPVPIQFVLCDSDTGVVQAVRHLDAPAALVKTLRAGGRAQVRAYATSSEVRQASALAFAEVLPHSVLAQAAAP